MILQNFSQETPLKSPLLSLSHQKHIIQDSVCRENVQILGHVRWFKMPIEELNIRIQKLANKLGLQEI